MKKFKFGLEKLLSYKNQILESEMQKLSTILAQITEKEKELATLRQNLVQAGNELDAKLKESVLPDECQRYQHYIDKLRDDIKRAEAELEALERARESQIDVIAEAKKESRSLEILKENQLSDYTEAQRKETEREIEEFISAQDALNREI